MASENSANAGSKVASGNGASPVVLSRADSRNEERDEGRRGVVGRELRVREVERARLPLGARFGLGMVGGSGKVPVCQGRSGDLFGLVGCDRGGLAIGMGMMVGCDLFTLGHVQAGSAGQDTVWELDGARATISLE